MMTAGQKWKLSVFAPAKINLFLHILNKRPDGYHNLDSLIVFADIGDRVVIEPQKDFAFIVKGPYSGAFSARELDTGPDSGNLAIRAVHKLSQATGKPLNFCITLIKNLPFAAGLGGGTADAAAAIWGLLEYWNISPQAPFMPGLLLSLGAEMPACLHCKAAQVGGIGEQITELSNIPELPVVLVNQTRRCQTIDVFREFRGPFREPTAIPCFGGDIPSFTDFLRGQHNDLTEAALKIVPDIADLLTCLERQPGALLSRMTGSGATCYAIFSTFDEAIETAERLAAEYPRWWVKAGWLNRPERY